MADFNSALTNVQNALQNMQAEATSLKVSFPDDLGPPFPSYAFDHGTIRILSAIMHAVQADIYRFKPPVIAQENTLEYIIHEISGTTPPKKIPIPGAEIEPVNATPLTEEEKKAAEANKPKIMPLSRFAKEFAITFSNMLPKYDVENPENINLENLDKLKVSERCLYNIIAKEITLLTNRFAEAGHPQSSLKKLKRVLECISQKKLKEATTLLNSAKEDDPNNKQLSYCLSQILYFQGFEFRSPVLPRAREESKHCCVYGDQSDDIELLHYRYQAVASERYFDPERTLNLMREYYLLSPETLLGDAGIAVHSGVHLKSLLLLATIPTKYWSSYEYDSILTIAKDSIGGCLFYIFFLREHLLEKINTKEEGFEGFIELEKKIHKLMLTHKAVTSPIKSNFNEAGKTSPSSILPWTTSNRFLTAFLSCASVPSFDEILMNIALTGRKYKEKAYPQNNILKQNLNYTIFWRAWAICISPLDEIRKIDMLPSLHVKAEAPVLKALDDALSALEEKEKQLIDANKWPLIQEFMPQYNYSMILQLGTGSTMAPGPKHATLSQYFSEWSKNSAISSTLPSEIIRIRATNGGFGSAKEAFAALDGVNKILTHPEHGFAISLEKAWELYNNPKRRKNRSTPKMHLPKADLNPMSMLKILAGFAIAAGATFAIVASASSTAEGILWFVIILAIAGVASFAFMIMKK